MILLLLLFGLLGALPEDCQGLQAGFQYQYQYTATISNWIPKDPRQSSGSALRATVSLQLSPNGNILVKASNIEVAEHHGKGTCEAFQHTDFVYSGMNSDEAAFLETPFLLHVNRTEVTYIEVPQEPVWVTNIRRGIINTIPLTPLAGQYPPKLTFGLKEETLIGKCFNWYSMLKLSHYQAELENQKQEELIEVDAQRERVARQSAPKSKGRQKTSSKGRKKTSSKTQQLPPAEYRLPSIQDTLFTLTRTLDDSECKDRHFTMKINGNSESVERTQRSSVGTFLLRGEGRVLRLEQAEVLGNVVIYSGESDDEFIRISSKQVLQLRAVTQMQETFPITYQAERRTLTFSVADGSRSTIKEKLLGITPGQQEIESNKAGILEDLSQLHNVNIMQGDDFLEIYQRLVERMSTLSWSDVEEIITQRESTVREINIIHEAFVASGRDEVLIHILERMKDEYFRAGSSLVFQILEAPTTPIRNPALLPAMLDVVSSMHEEEEVSKAVTLLNIAKLANQYCLNPQTANTCDQGCDTDFIFNTLLPMISQGLQDPLKWKKLLSVQAMCALGSPYSIDYLQPIIEGISNQDIDVRSIAIYCLISDLLPKTARGMVFDILMPVMKNPTELPEIRSFAFIILTTWHPGVPWWEHVALSSWKEKSAGLVSFISSTLSSLSKVNDSRSNFARKVVHLAKHPQHSEKVTFARSTHFFLNEVVRNCKARSTMILGWFSSMQSSLPRMVFYRLQLVTVMGVSQKEKGMYLTKLGRSYHHYFQPAIISATRSEDSMTFREIYEELKEDLGLRISSTIDETLFQFLLVLDPLPSIVTLFSDADGTLQIKADIYHPLNFAAQPKKHVHFRLTDSTLVLPSDVGLPMLIKLEDDFVLTSDVNLTRGLDRHDFRLSLSLNQRVALNAKTLVPWSGGLMVGAGVAASHSITLPPILITPQSRLSRTLSISIELLAYEQVKVLSVSNVVYTSLMPLYQIVDTLISEEYDSNNHGRIQVWTGEIYEGRIPTLPFGNMLMSECKGNFKTDKCLTYLQSLNFMQLQYLNYDYRLVLNPGSLSTKRVTFIFKIDLKEGSDRLTEQVSDEFGQQRQGADDYDYMGQVAQSSFSSGFEDYDEQFSSSSGFEEEQHSQTFGSHLEKMQAMMMPSMGGKMYTVSVTMKPENSPVKYEMAVNMVASRGNIDGRIETKIRKMHIAFFNLPMPGAISNTGMICLDLRMETPYLLPLMSKEILRETNLASEFLINFYKEDNCEGSPSLSLQGTLDVNSAAIQAMHTMEERSICDEDFQRLIYPFYNQVHLKATQQGIGNILGHSVREIPIFDDMMEISYTATGTENEATAEAVLDIEKGEWNITLIGHRVSLNTHTHVAGIPLPSPFTGPDAFVDLDKSCHVTHQSVKTFDGLLHSFEPSSCWTTAAIHSNSDQGSISSYLDAAIQVRFTEEWEVRLIRPDSAVVLDITRSQLMVNEEPFSGHSDKFITHRFSDSQMVGIGMVAVRVGDTVDIMVSELYHGEVMGICGKYDGEPANDMMGPTGCLYTDPALYSIAWSSAGTGCSRFALRNKKRGLEEYQENCNKVFFQPTGLTQNIATANCTEWRYDEHTDPTGLHCKSKVPTAACRQGCNPSQVSSKEIRYNCRMPSSGSGGLLYGENEQCFGTTSPMATASGCLIL